MSRAGRAPATLVAVLAFALAGAAAAGAPLPPCEVGDAPAPRAGYADYPFTVLDTLHALPADYAPPDLVPASEAGLDAEGLVRRVILEDLRALVAAAAANGTPIELQSAYRSHAYQERTFRYWVERDGYDYALRSSARAGHSEHQLGTAIDVRSAGGRAPWELEDWAATPAGAWMAANAWRYGFTMSYPAGLEPLTCYVYEPWHYRYVGRDVARRVRESGAPLRAWLWEALP